MPEERRPEAEMTDGRLLIRARAAERARASAPPAVYDAQRERHRLAAEAERDAILAGARGSADEALRLQSAAAEHAAAAAHLDTVADARARWLLHHTETLTAGDTARVELYRRGLGPGIEADRTTADELLRYREWMDAEARARAEDDAHRTITEADLDDAGRYAAASSEAVVRGEAHGITESERQRILRTAARRGLQVDIQAPIVAEDELRAAGDSDVTDPAAERDRPRIATVLADLDRLGSPPSAPVVLGSVVDARDPARVHDDARSARGLTADAAAAEIEAASAAAARAADRLADEASQNAAADTAGARQGLQDNDTWDARRAAQINAENDAVADSGRWHYEAANYSDHGAGAEHGEYVDSTQHDDVSSLRDGVA